MLDNKISRNASGQRLPDVNVAVAIGISSQYCRRWRGTGDGGGIRRLGITHVPSLLITSVDLASI